MSKLRDKPFPVSEIRFALLVSASLFLALRAVHLVIRFQVMGLPQVIGATTIFVAIAAAWIWAAVRISGFRFEMPTKSITWVITPVLTLFWWFASSPVNSVFTRRYAPEFPMQTIDAGGNVAKDTFFHSGLIQSIMQFGYPSTGLDGTPVTPYHVLSHFVDAGILIATGLAPLDSAGLLLQLKVMLFVVSVLMLLWIQLRAFPSWAQVSAAVLFLPVFSGTWHVVGSHGLWFTTLVMLISAPFVFEQVSSTTNPSIRALVAIGFIGVALSFGKISVGFMFMLVVGLLLWLRKMRDIRVYVLGVAWALFLSGYGLLIAADRPDVTAVPFTVYERFYGVARYLLLRDLSSSLIVGLYALITILIVVFLVQKSLFRKHLLITTGVGMSVLSVLAFARIDANDMAYFTQALFFITLTMSIGVIAQTANNTDPVTIGRTSRTVSRRTIVVSSALVLLGLIAPRSDFSAVYPNPSVVRQSLTTAFTPATQPTSTTDGLVEFRDALDEFATQNGLNAYNSQLFIPREIWNDIQANHVIDSDSTNGWSLPLLVYAATGIPLYKGVYVTRVSYGFAAYGSDSVTPSRAEFAQSLNCEDAGIIEVVAWSPARFSLACEASQ